MIMAKSEGVSGCNSGAGGGDCGSNGYGGAMNIGSSAYKA